MQIAAGVPSHMTDAFGQSAGSSEGAKQEYAKAKPGTIEPSCPTL